MDAAHKSWWQVSELVFGVPFLAALALQLVLPLSFLYITFLAPVIIALGLAFIVFGIALIVLARREFAQLSQPTDPGRPTTKIVTTGVFSISRNPIYLGATCFLLGIALVFNLPWALILLIPSLVACHYVLIAPEEKYLLAKFGEEYGVYASTVHRWLGRVRTPKEHRV